MGVGLFIFFPIWVIAVFLIALDEQKDVSNSVVCQKVLLWMGGVVSVGVEDI